MASKRSVLLVNPWIFDFAAFDFWIKPLGLLYLAGFLRKNGCAVRFIDCLDPYHPSLMNMPDIVPPKRYPDGRGKFLKEKISRPEPLKDIPRSYHRYGISPRIFEETLLQGEKPDLVLVTSMMTYWYPGVFDTIKIISRIWPGLPVVLGGAYVTFCFEHASGHSGADFVLPGEGEKELPPLFRILFRDDFQFVPDFDNLDSYPYPAFDLIPRLNQVPILTSRGCPFRCTYCASHVLNPRFLRRNPYRVAEEIAFWNRSLGVIDFSIYDDAFLFKPEEMAVPLLREILRRGLRCRFHCPNGLHLREVTDELARLFFQTGFTTLRFGFETSDANAQIKTGGKTTNRDFVNAVRSLMRAGYDPGNIGVYLLCGLPGQAAGEVRESIRFVRSVGAKPILAEYSPIPGTDLWQEALNVSPYPLEVEPLFQNNSLLPCSSEHLSQEDYTALKKMVRDSDHPSFNKTKGHDN